MRLDPNAPSLSDEETDSACAALSKKLIFREAVKTVCDPAIVDQKIGLITFVPAQGSQANSKGVYGYCKLRGNYSNENDASFQARNLIQHNDSYHEILHVRVGSFFPLGPAITDALEQEQKIDEVSLNKDIKETIAQSVQRAKADEEAKIKEVKDRAESIKNIKDDAPEADTVLDTYISKRVKRSTLKFTLEDYKKQIDTIGPLILQAEVDIVNMEKENPELQEQYYDHYKSTLENIGVKLDDERFKNNYYKFLMDNIELTDQHSNVQVKSHKGITPAEVNVL